MKFSGKIVGVISALIILSLTGLVLLQASLLNSAMQLKEQAFRQNIFAALQSIVQRLEIGETATIASEAVRNDSLTVGIGLSGRRLYGDSLRASVTALCNDSTPSAPFNLDHDTLRYVVASPRHVRIRVESPDSSQGSTLVDTFQTAGSHFVVVPGEYCGKTKVMFRFESDSDSSAVHCFAAAPNQIDSGTAVNSKKLKIVRLVIDNLTAVVVDNLTAAERTPIEQRLKAPQLDSAVKAGLMESKIDLPYAFAVGSGVDDSLPIVSDTAYAKDLRRSEFRTRLFPSDIFAPSNELILYFPGYRAYVRQQITPHLVLTALFMLIITLCFAYTIRTISRQKQLATRLVDFINNMTHEFKTPLATVELATDALLRPESATDNAKIARYGGMIREENNRMRSQVDKILQMAALEEKDYDLILTGVDVHEIIKRAAASMTLLVEQRGGTMTCRLEALQHIITADVVHFTNIIHNLLENAVKYSPDKPDIIVSTINRDGGIEISIQDHGIGISSKDKKLVFEKYYRVSSGDVQNVRGFGIGLAYVRLMMDAMGGQTSLESEPGRGTEVKLFFPNAAV